MVELIAWLRVTTGLLIVEISGEIFLASNFGCLPVMERIQKRSPCLLYIHLVCTLFAAELLGFKIQTGVRRSLVTWSHTQTPFPK